MFLPADRAAYEAASDSVMTALRSLGAVTEVMGWDEAFLAVDAGDPEGFARRVQETIKAATQLDCTVGIGENKLQAKLATNFGKPAGVFRLTHATWFERARRRAGDRAVGRRREDRQQARRSSASGPSPTSRRPTSRR